jgi:hypothetical protein
MPLEFKRINILGLEIGSDSPDGILTGNGYVLVLILLGFTVLNYFYNGLFRPLFTDKIDFEAYYNAALAFKSGAPLYDLMIKFFEMGPAKYEGPLPYVYPPPFAVFLSPLANMELNHAILFWNILNQIFFFSGMLLLIKTIARKYSWMELGALIFVCMNFRPLFVDHLLGQCNIILFFFMVLTLYFYRLNKNIYAGIFLAMACIIKIIPCFLLAYFLWKRQYKLFAAGVLTLFLIFVYSLLFFDMDLYVWYFEFMSNQTLFDAYHDNHALTGFFTRLLAHTIWTRGILNSPMAAKVCIAVSSLTIIAVFFVLTRKRCEPEDDRTLHEYGLAIITMLLLSKMTSTPYLVMLLPCIGIWVHELFKNRVSNKWMLLSGAAYGIVAIWYPLAAGKFLHMDAYKIILKGFWVNVFSIQFFALAVFWWYFAFGPSVSKSSNILECESEQESGLEIGQ